MKKITAVFSFLIFLATSVSPASAHSDVDRTSPAAGASVDAGVQSISVYFTDKILQLATSSELVISDGQGNEVAAACLEVGKASISAEALLSTAGVYKVVWRTVAKDGHPISGKFSFTVTGTTEATNFISCQDQAAQTPAVIATPKASTTTESVVVSSDEARIARLYWVGGLVALAVGILVLVLLRRKRTKA